MKINKQICKVIRELRIKRKIDQDEMSNKLHITQASYSRLESGRTQITITRLSDICNELCVDITSVINQAIDLQKIEKKYNL